MLRSVYMAISPLVIIGLSRMTIHCMASGIAWPRTMEESQLEPVARGTWSAGCAWHVAHPRLNFLAGALVQLAPVRNFCLFWLMQNLNDLCLGDLRSFLRRMPLQPA